MDIVFASFSSKKDHFRKLNVVIYAIQTSVKICVTSFSDQETNIEQASFWIDLLLPIY